MQEFEESIDCIAIVKSLKDLKQQVEDIKSKMSVQVESPDNEESVKNKTNSKSVIQIPESSLRKSHEDSKEPSRADLL